MIFSSLFTKVKFVIKLINEKKEGEFSIIKTIQTFVFVTTSVGEVLPYLYTPQLIIATICTIIDVYLRWRYVSYDRVYTKIFSKDFIIIFWVVNFTTAVMIRIIFVLFEFVKKIVKEKRTSL